MYCKVLIEVEEELFSFTLPSPLFNLYMESIVHAERGQNVALNDAARREWHNQLQYWWSEEIPLPHVSIDKFNRALGRTVEYALPQARRLF